MSGAHPSRQGRQRSGAEPRVPTPRISAEAVRRATGRDRTAWFVLLGCNGEKTVVPVSTGDTGPTIDTVPPEITHVSNALATVDLAAGIYRVESRVGLLNARASRDVTVAAGRATDLVFDHDAGALNLRLAPAIAGDVHWDVRDNDGRIVWISGQPAPKLVLQAGRYQIRGETRDKRFLRDVEVKSGATQTLEFKD